jgi:glycosyltransferase involved in cell wall biosynthesis
MLLLEKVSISVPIKILFLLSNFLAGGAERQYFNLIHGIDKQAFEVHVGLIQYRNSRPSKALFESLHDVRVRLFERMHRADLSVIREISQYARQNNIDVIQSLLFMDNQIARLAGLISRKPVVTSVRGEPLPLLGRYKTWLEFRMQGLSKKVVVNSNWLKANLVGHGSNPEKVVVIHNGTESGNFRSDADPAVVRTKYGIPEDAMVMGIVARLHPIKDHVTFFDTVKIVRESYPSVHALVAGDGEMMVALKEYVKKIAIEKNVTFLGTITDELPDVYRIMNVFLLTSLSESFPNVILEAMSASVPVVATNISDVPAIICDGQNGYMVEIRNPTMMAERVISAMSNPQVRELFIRNGLARVEEFGVKAMVKKYEQLYGEIYNA